MEELLELYQEMGISPAVYAYGEKALEGLKAMGEEEDTQRKPSQQVRAAYQE